MLKLEFTAQFRRDQRRMEKRGADMKKLRAVLLKLTAEEDLAPQYKDHLLKGEWFGCHELHLEPDWLMIYEFRGLDTIVLMRTGTHSDLF